jgi:phage gp36-like protein
MYSTRTDITKLLPEDIIIQLTDDENLKPATIDPTNAAHAAIIARIDEAIESADAEIDGYCAVKYSVPFTIVPRLITGLSVELAIYYLYTRRTIPEDIQKRYDRAVSRLKDIAKGLMTLGVDPPSAPSVSSGGAESNKTTSDRIFTIDKMRGF